MKTVTASKLKVGDILIKEYQSIEPDAMRIVDIRKHKEGVVVDYHDLLPSGRWSKRLDTRTIWHGDVKIADTKKEAMQLISSVALAIVGSRRVREQEEFEEYAGTERLPFFVYGTLRPGMGNYYSYFEGYTVAEMPAKIRGKMYASGIPFVTEGDMTIHGDLLYVKDEDYASVLYHVDGLEGYRPNSSYNNYTRKKVTVTLEDKSTVEAWCYFMEQDEYFMRRVKSGAVRLVPSGDYIQYCYPNGRRMVW